MKGWQLEESCNNVAAVTGTDTDPKTYSCDENVRDPTQAPSCASGQGALDIGSRKVVTEWEDEALWMGHLDQWREIWKCEREDEECGSSDEDVSIWVLWA